jgi:predicted nuclease of predicted toxin-antitoxin system
VTSSFPLFTDNHVRQQLVEALRRRGWDVVRAIDVFPERTSDDALFEYAAREGRIFVTNDERIHAIAVEWLRQGRPFRMIFWIQSHHQRMSEGDFVAALDELRGRPHSFNYPIEYVRAR